MRRLPATVFDGAVFLKAALFSSPAEGSSLPKVGLTTPAVN